MTELPSSFLIRHLARVIESSEDAIVSKDLNGIITSWNRAAERIFGFTAAEAVGRSIRMIIPADRQTEEDHVLSSIRAGRAVPSFDTIRQRKDGTLVPISVTVSPVHDDDGAVIGASKVARDISDRKRADFTANRLAAVVQFSDDAIVTKTLEGVITSWNRAAERMFGYTEAEAIGKSIRMLIPDHLQSEEDNVLARIRAGEGVDHYETVRQRKDGSRLFVSLTVSPLRDESGVLIGASKIARDVTERARLMAAVREQSAITQKLSEVGAAVASMLDREAVVQKVIDVATDLTRADFGGFFYSVVEASGEARMQFALAGPGKPAVNALPMSRSGPIFGPLFRRDAPVRIDDVTDHAAQEMTVPCFGIPLERLDVRSYLSVPVTTASGGVLGGLLFGHSQPGQFTGQHERLAVGIAGWATVALENARLYVDVRDANRMKDEFLAVLSHELRTPLNAIVGYARLLRGGILSGEKAERGLETLERNASWLTQIVEDVLDVSRIVSGKLRLDVQPVELPLVIHNSVATVQPAADAKGVRLETILDSRVAPIAGDPDRLQQVIWNLLANAVKFTPRGGRVQVRLERVNSHVELVVSDTGAGIPAAFLPHVFERFRQADAGTTRTTGGLGLGLAIVRHIVEMHGGTVSAASAGDGEGATFRVKLPLMIVHPETLERPRQHPASERIEPLTGLGRLDGTRVLAVDDDHDALMLLRVVLETAGADVVTLSSGSSVLQQLGAVRPDVLVMDLGMPGMDGFELISRIRSSGDEAVRNIPAAALTAFARSEDRTRALRSGFEMHLAKPVDPGELVASVATLARRRGGGQAP